MSKAVIHSTFVIERSFAKPTEKVFAAFSEARLKRLWFADETTSAVEEFQLDFRVGGAECTRYRFLEGTPFPGVTLTNHGSYLDIQANSRIVTTSAMMLGEQRISASLITFEFLRTEQGTDLICTNQSAFFEGSDGPRMREGGWKRLLDRLGEAMNR